MFRQIGMAAIVFAGAAHTPYAHGQMFAAKSSWNCLANDRGNPVLQPSQRAAATERTGRSAAGWHRMNWLYRQLSDRPL